MFNERLGFTRFEMTSADHVLSTAIEAPTTCRRDLVIVVPEGEAIPNLLGEGELLLPQNVRVHSLTTAAGTLSGDRFAGEFSIGYTYSGIPNLPDDFALNVNGRFEVFLG